MRYVPALLLAVAGTATPVLAGDVIFIDGWESGSPCSWASEFAACGVGTEMVITLPGDAVTMTLMYIPAGTFWMGSPEDEQERTGDEAPHEVTLTSGYFVSKFEVTQGQWAAVMGSPPDLTCSNGQTYGVGADFPVYCVSWGMVAGSGGFIETLNEYLMVTSQSDGVRLPTEAEWERAARAGSQTRFSHGDVMDCYPWVSCPTHDLYMWWAGSEPYTNAAHPVGSRLENGFGLHDMHGNVLEWVQDWWQYDLGTSPQVDPTGPMTGSRGIGRGGFWNYEARYCRSADRESLSPELTSAGLGFRLAMTADQPQGALP